MEHIQDLLYRSLMEQGACDVGFCTTPDGVGELHGAISIAVRLSSAIIDEITDQPTYTYFNHYRSVNTFIDQLLLKAGLILQQHEYQYLTVAASQSLPTLGRYEGRYSHKKAAVLAGLGTMGDNNLFLHKKYGARVRLGTVFCDYPFKNAAMLPGSMCSHCGECKRICPAGAIASNGIFDPELCSRYMKQEFQKIGRGSVCGLCMRVCPASNAKQR